MMSLISELREGHYRHLEGKYPAKAHAKRVADAIKASGVTQDGLIYLQGQKTHLIEDNDTPQKFR
jgi:Xaa-Pro dipeptidase